MMKRSSPIQASPVYILSVQTMVGDVVMLCLHTGYFVPAVFFQVTTDTPENARIGLQVSIRNLSS